MFYTPLQCGNQAETSLAQILGAFSYALDLTEGQPAGHSVRSCWIGSQIGIAIGLTPVQRHQLYYTLLLKDLGCSSNAARICELYQADDRAFKQGYKTVGTSLAATLHFVFSRTAVSRPWQSRVSAVSKIIRNGDAIAQDLIVTRCTRGADIARSLRFPEPVSEGIYSLDEHWDGSGRPNRLRGHAIPLFSRIALLAQIVDVFHQHAGAQAALDEIARRSGSWLDPELVTVALRLGAKKSFWSDLASPFVEAKLTPLAPPDHELVVDDEYLDDIAAAFGSVIDAKSPFTSGHSTRVAALSSSLAKEMGMLEPRRRWLHRAALLHDVGKLGVSNAILDKPAGLNEKEWAEMRDHAVHTRAILDRIGALSDISSVAASHHERLDGRGYPLGLMDKEIKRETRLITTCDFYDALTADRPYRAAMGRKAALEIMGAEVGGGLDHECFEALISVVEGTDRAETDR